MRWVHRYKAWVLGIGQREWPSKDPGLIDPKKTPVVFFSFYTCEKDSFRMKKKIQSAAQLAPKKTHFVLDQLGQAFDDRLRAKMMRPSGVCDQAGMVVGKGSYDAIMKTLVGNPPVTARGHGPSCAQACCSWASLALRRSAVACIWARWCPRESPRLCA